MFRELCCNMEESSCKEINLFYGPNFLKSILSIPPSIHPKVKLSDHPW